MMYIENLVLRFAMAVLTCMTVTEKNIFSGVPEPHLFSLLVLFALYVGILEQLCVELCDLDDGFRYREERMDFAYERQM